MTNSDGLTWHLVIGTNQSINPSMPMCVVLEQSSSLPSGLLWTNVTGRLSAYVCHALSCEEWVLTGRLSTNTVEWQPVVSGATMHGHALSHTLCVGQCRVSQSFTALCKRCNVLLAKQQQQQWRSKPAVNWHYWSINACLTSQPQPTSRPEWSPTGPRDRPASLLWDKFKFNLPAGQNGHLQAHETDQQVYCKISTSSTFRPARMVTYRPTRQTSKSTVG